jgi:hypothetical protein
VLRCCLHFSFSLEHTMGSYLLGLAFVDLIRQAVLHFCRLNLQVVLVDA